MCNRQRILTMYTYFKFIQRISEMLSTGRTVVHANATQSVLSVGNVIHKRVSAFASQKCTVEGVTPAL